jgi:hypothetical protein
MEIRVSTVIQSRMVGCRGRMMAWMAKLTQGLVRSNAVLVGLGLVNGRAKQLGSLSDRKWSTLLNLG